MPPEIKTPAPNGSGSYPYEDGRDDRIRTCDLIVPNDALYQAEPHPDMDSIVAMFLIFVKQYAPAACVYRIAQLFPVPCGQRLRGVP